MYQAGQKHVPFMPQFQEELEAAYQDYIENPHAKNNVHYKFKYPNGYDYQLNFEKMTQLNQQTGVRRTISRVDIEELTNHPEYQVSTGFSQSYKLPHMVAKPIDLNQLTQDNQQTISTHDLFNDSFKFRNQIAQPTIDLSDPFLDNMDVNINQTSINPSYANNENSPANNQQEDKYDAPNQQEDKYDIPNQQENCDYQLYQELTLPNDNNQSNDNNQPNGMSFDINNTDFQEGSGSILRHRNSWTY